MGTWRLLVGVLDNYFDHPVLHRDTSSDTLGGPDLDFIDFACALGSSWESLSGPVGDKCVILDVQLAFGIREAFFSKIFS